MKSEDTFRTFCQTLNSQLIRDLPHYKILPSEWLLVRYQPYNNNNNNNNNNRHRAFAISVETVYLIT